MSEEIINLKDYFVHHYDDWGRLYCVEFKGSPLELENSIKRLQAENYELKESLKVFQRPDIQKVLTLYKVGDIDLLEQKCERLEQENERLKGVLEKIRETLNNMPTTTDFKETETFLRIQNKINEVLK